VTPAQEKIRRWREDPLYFVTTELKASPDPWQADTLNALAGGVNPRRRLGMKACTGPGKSAVLAWIGWHRLACFADKGEHPKGAALSGEGRDNLRDNLWAELAKWQQRSEFLKRAFALNVERIFAKDHAETWFLSARSYAKDADSEAIGRALSGLHSRYPFVLLDETGDMPVEVGQKAEQIFTGGPVDALIAAAGNPTSLTGLLYHISTIARELWVVITITGDPDDAKAFFYSPRFGPQAADDARAQLKLYGRDNPWVMATILGLFPPGGFNQLITVADVEAAMERMLKPNQYDFSQKRFGVDVAREGDDRTIIFPRQGLHAKIKPIEMRNAKGQDVASRIALAQSNWQAKDMVPVENVFIDDTGGFGGSVIDAYQLAGYAPVPVNFSGKADDARYFNKRSEMWFRMADWVKKGGSLPRRPGLLKELTAPTYTFHNGKFRLEEKDQIKKRLKFSPDEADGLALTFAFVEMPASIAAVHPSLAAGGNKTVSDWDPFR